MEKHRSPVTPQWLYTKTLGRHFLSLHDIIYIYDEEIKISLLEIVSYDLKYLELNYF